MFLLSSFAISWCLLCTAALVAATVSHGESNSVLLLGHRGTGKTAILEDVLAEEDVEGRNCRFDARVKERSDRGGGQVSMSSGVLPQAGPSSWPD